MARGGIPASPLPQRDGVDAVRLRMPQDGPWSSLREHLVDRLPLPAETIDRMLAAGEFAGPDGHPLAWDAPFVPRSVVWVHREPAPEPRVPGQLRLLYQDERIVVVDKPPFLATMPRGQHIRETVVTRLRVALGLPRLAPAHRLDRLTSGVLVLTTEQRWRGSYQTLFARGLVEKTYLASAPVRPDLSLPTTVSVHLAKPRGSLQTQVIDGARANSVTEVHLLAHRDGLGLYRVRPLTGRTHQIRAHMCHLGIAICGDPLYPEVLDVAADDFGTPLSLVASALRFLDPIEGKSREFVSDRLPAAWVDKVSGSSPEFPRKPSPAPGN